MTKIIREMNQTAKSNSISHSTTFPRTPFDRWTCHTQLAVDEIGDKWTLFIIREFVFGDSREMGFNELLRALAPISSRTLALKLVKLQEQQILIRRVVRKVPLKVAYSITQKGLALEESLQSLATWHKKYS